MLKVNWSSATRIEAHSIVSSYRTVHSNDHIIESVTLPDELVRDAGGQIAFQESSVRVNYKLHDHNYKCVCNNFTLNYTVKCSICIVHGITISTRHLPSALHIQCTLHTYINSLIHTCIYKPLTADTGGMDRT